MMSNPNASKGAAPLLDIRNLKTYFRTMDGTVRAVDGVTLSIDPGKTLGVVGESGCGKSVTSFSVMRLLSSNGYIEDGQILFDGQDIVQASEEDMRKIRGNHMSMIF